MKSNLSEKPSRDYTVELWRFLFCIVVLGFHFFSKIDLKPFKAGYLGVEFFFLLSGYGVYMFYQKHMSGKCILDRFDAFVKYIGQRIIRLYPLYFLSVLSMLIVKMFLLHWSIGDTMAYIKTQWAEWFWLQCGPLGGEVLISANWYVPSLFWSSILLVLLMVIFDQLGVWILCPLISLGIYTYFYRLIHKIDVIFSYYAVMRAIAGVGLGIFLGALITWCMKKLTDTNISEKFLHDIRLFCFVIGNLMLTFVLVYVHLGHRSGWDYAIIALYFIAIFLLLFGKMKTSDKWNVVFGKLGKMTYPIYLFQMPAIEVILFVFGLK